MKKILITGATAGIGRHAALALVREGHHVIASGRREEALTALARECEGLPGKLETLRLDVTDEAAVRAAAERIGPVDVLVNNAGTIQVGPLDAMTLADFDYAMKLHCAAPLRLSLWLRDDMRERGGGRIANVASIGGIISVPHLLPYSASKFALMGLSQGLRAELARDNIFVSTIAPGLMRTGSPPNATFKGDHEKEYAWFKISDSLPLLSVSSEHAAKRIVRALERGEPHVVIGLPAKLAALAAALAPDLLSNVLTLANAVLPSGVDPDPRMGWGSESALTRSGVTALSDRASLRNNEA